MKNKGFFKTAAILLAALVLLGGFSVTAYAGGGEDIPFSVANRHSNNHDKAWQLQ